MKYFNINNTTRTKCFISTKPTNYLNLLSESGEMETTSIAPKTRSKLLYNNIGKRNSAVTGNVNSCSQVTSQRKASSVLRNNNLYDFLHEITINEAYSNNNYVQSLLTRIKESKEHEILFNNNKYYVKNIKIVRLDPKVALLNTDKSNFAKSELTCKTYELPSTLSKSYKNSCVSLMPRKILALPRCSRLMVLKRTSRNLGINAYSAFLQIRPAEKNKYSSRLKLHTKRILPEIMDKKMCNKSLPSSNVNKYKRMSSGMVNEELKVDVNSFPKVNFKVKIKPKNQDKL